MRKTALTLMLSTLVLSAFGAFFHWLQMMNVFETETGLAALGARSSIVFVVYSLLAALAMAGLSFFLRRRCEQPRGEEGLRWDSPLPRVITVVCGLLFAVAAIQQMFTAGGAGSPLMQRVFGAAGLIAAGALMALPTRRDGTVPALSRYAALWLPLFCCYWLVLIYRDNAQDPVLWDYATYICAAALSALAFYHLSAWYFRRAMPGRALFFIQLAVYLDACALTEAHSIWIKLLLAAAAVVLAMEEYVLISNMREKAEES